MKGRLSVSVVLFLLIQINSVHAEDANGNLSLKKIPLSTGKNFLKLFRSGNLAPLIEGAAATAISTSFEDEIHEYFKQRNTAGKPESAGGALGSAYLVAPAIVTVLIVGHNSKKMSVLSHFRTR